MNREALEDAIGAIVARPGERRPRHHLRWPACTATTTPTSRGLLLPPPARLRPEGRPSRLPDLQPAARRHRRAGDQAARRDHGRAGAGAEAGHEQADQGPIHRRPGARAVHQRPVLHEQPRPCAGDRQGDERGHSRGRRDGHRLHPARRVHLALLLRGLGHRGVQPAVEGVKNAKIVVHVCWGNWGGTPAYYPDETAKAGEIFDLTKRKSDAAAPSATALGRAEVLRGATSTCSTSRTAAAASTTCPVSTPSRSIPAARQCRLLGRRDRRQEHDHRDGRAGGRPDPQAAASTSRPIASASPPTAA